MKKISIYFLLIGLINGSLLACNWTAFDNCAESCSNPESGCQGLWVACNEQYGPGCLGSESERSKDAH